MAFKRDIIHQTIHHYGLILLACSLPFYMQLSSILIILLLLNWIIEGKYSQKLHHLRQHRTVFFFVGYYLLHTISLLYSTDLGDGLFNLEKKLSFLILPLILSSHANISNKQYHHVLIAFVVSCIMASIICLAVASYQYYITHDSSNFFYHKLGAAINLHAIYFSMYLFLSIFIIIYFFSNHWKKQSSLTRLGVALLLIYLSIIIILLSSKIIIITGLVLLNLFFILYLANKFKRKATILYIIPANILTLILITSIPQVNQRFQHAIATDFTFIMKKKVTYDENNSLTGISLRLMQWRFSLEVIAENNAWILGMGIGGVQKKLDQKYKDANFYTGNGKTSTGYLGYNSHNQYVETCLRLGIVGLAYLLIFLIAVYRVAIKEKNYLFFAFLTLISIICITESLLEANKGIIFFVFFGSTFISKHTNKLVKNNDN